MGERLKGKVAIVTGAGSILAGMGNGKATAILFAREGAKVMLVDLNPEAAEETKQLIDNENGESIVFKGDVSMDNDCSSMIDKCINTFGSIDILDNNVGMGSYGGPVELSEEDWDKVMNVNLKSMFLTCKYVLPHMEKQGNGSIINISSMNAIRAQPGPAVAYAASKAGVIALTRDVANQYAAKGIRVNAILPGFMKTPTQEFWGTKAYGGDVNEMWRRRDAMVPTGKQGDAWDIAYAALFLASDEAKYITGTSIIVDGGLTNICTSKLW